MGGRLGRCIVDKWLDGWRVGGDLPIPHLNVLVWGLESLYLGSWITSPPIRPVHTSGSSSRVGPGQGQRPKFRGHQLSQSGGQDAGLAACE